MRYAALFNAAEEPDVIAIPLAELGVSGAARAKELWTGQQLGSLDRELTAEVPPHGAALSS
ncbi:hypothetical protein ACFFK0_06640 [Paenibacillus chartarius]|uniref:Alpha galactosidase C-terminal domain-containing protein n=1 Tax=Paenibacillus chartarius TaxID=747481 RepID=A0ABV6DHK5_9BACL